MPIPRCYTGVNFIKYLRHGLGETHPGDIKIVSKRCTASLFWKYSLGGVKIDMEYAPRAGKIKKVCSQEEISHETRV